MICEIIEPLRIVSDPLRLEGDLGVNFRFLFAIPIFLIGLGLGFLGGFYNERRLFASALIGCGLLCILIGWTLSATKWL